MPMSGLRSALETALRENPDDLAAHMAYGDYLAEEGDPRGEFIQVQIALEDPSRSAEERKRLRQREQELLSRHLADWVGSAHVLFTLGDSHWIESGPFGLQYIDANRYRYRFARGWLESMTLG